MFTAFLIPAVISVLSTALAISSARIVYALLYLILSLLSAAVIIFLLGAPFAAALEVIVYAGAIIVTFIFVIMLLNLRGPIEERERLSLRLPHWLLPLFLGAILLGEFLYVLNSGSPAGLPAQQQEVAPHLVGAALFGPYLLAVLLAAFLFLIALIGACHLGDPAAGRRIELEVE